MRKLDSAREAGGESKRRPLWDPLGGFPHCVTRCDICPITAAQVRCQHRRGNAGRQIAILPRGPLDPGPKKRVRQRILSSSLSLSLYPRKSLRLFSLGFDCIVVIR